MFAMHAVHAIHTHHIPLRHALPLSLDIHILVHFLAAKPVGIAEDAIPEEFLIILLNHSLKLSRVIHLQFNFCALLSLLAPPAQSC